MCGATKFKKREIVQVVGGKVKIDHVVLHCVVCTWTGTPDEL
jgi:hypothetical protein